MLVAPDVGPHGLSGLPVCVIADRTMTLADVANAVRTLRLPIAQAQGESALRAFRYRHKLISADECQRWLASRRLSYDELSASFRRQTAGKAAANAHEAIVDLLLADNWAELARAVAARVAVCLDDPPNPDLDDWHAIDQRFRLKLQAQRTPEMRARRLAESRTRLRRLRLTQMELDTMDAAREAWSCVVIDGAELEAVALDAGLPIQTTVRWFDALHAVERGALGALKPGQITPPIEANGRWLLLGLRGLIEPALGDADVDRRIDQECDEQTTDQILRDVCWRLP